MKYDINKSPATSRKIKWLRQEQYHPYAMALISSNTDENGDTNLEAIAQEVKRLADGGTTSKGKSVYIRHLMGTIKQISPEMAADIMAQHESTTTTKSLSDF